jgi:serine/threonine protein kinase
MAHTEDRENLVIAGRYRLAHLEDVGAAPEAWRAEGLSGGAFTVFYYPDAALSGLGAQRFLRDVPFLRGVEHPKLVALIDAGADPTGAVYGACARCDGETLAARVERRGPLHYDDALRVVCDALEALGALHERNVVHQGITSADVLIVQDPDGRPRGRLLLGGALGVIARGAQRTGVHAKAFGSPHHLAPEQCRAQAATPETDVWAMGVVLYEALAGSAPFDGETPLEVIASVLGSEPPSLDGRVPAPLVSVLHDALAKRAADRPPDAEAMCLMLAAARSTMPPPGDLVDVPTDVMPSRLKTSGITRGQPTEFDVDLDSLVTNMKSEASPATDFSETFATAESATRPLRVTPPALAPTELPPPIADFDLDFGAPSEADATSTPGSALPPPPTSLSATAPSPSYIPELPAETPSAAPSNAARESITHTALSPEVVDRTKAPRAPRVRTVNPYVAVLGVSAVTALIGYAGWELSGTDKPHGVIRSHADAHSAVSNHAARATDGGDAERSADPVSDESLDAPHPENQTPVEFGEQLMIPLPTVAHDAVGQLVRHVVTAALPDTATAPGFATCADQTLFLHPGGLVPALRSGPVDARCDAADLALIPDVDGDHASDVVAVSADNSMLWVVGSRAFRTVKRIPLQGAVAVVAGLSHSERRRTEPVVVAYVAPRNGSAALVAVGVRTGNVYWRTPTEFTPAFARDYGLAVGPDADGDGTPDVLTGVLREGTRCVMLLSGADGSARWPSPQCFDGASAQTLSLGPDVNDDHRADVALGNAVEGRVRILSGRDGRNLRLIEPPSPGEGISFGLGAILMPDTAHDGFADLAVPRNESGAVSVDVFSANDAHRLGRRELPIRENQASAAVRVQFIENFSFAGSRSILVASPAGLSIIGAAPRPEIRDQAAPQ